MTVPTSTNELERLRALHELGLLDGPNEKEFDDLVRLASAICVTSISLLSLVDETRQWCKSSFGTDLKQTHRNLSFCSHAIEQTGLFIIEDATRDLRFQTNPLVTGEPCIRFYAGIPLLAPGGAPIGALCVLDTVPRQLTEQQKDALIILGAQVQARLELRSKHQKLEQSLRENELLCTTLQTTNDLFLAFMNNGPFASYIKDGEGRMLFYNQFLAQRYGVTQQAWLGKNDDELWPKDIAEGFRRNDLAVLEGRIPVELDEVSPGADGEQSFWKSIKFPYISRDGTPMLAGMSIDVTRELTREAELEDALREKSKLAGQLQASQHLLQNFMEHVPNIAYVKDEDGRYVFYNRRFADHFGIDRLTRIGQCDHDFVPKAVADAFRKHDLGVMRGEQVVEVIDQVRDAAGSVHSFRSIKFTYKDVEGRSLLAGVAVDITALLKREAELAEANFQLALLATLDSLTDLPNRRIFESRAEIEFSIARRKKRPLSVLIIDTDDFKYRNDRFGHAAGDEALRTLGKVLRSCLRIGDMAARVGGEEFAFLLPETDAAGTMEVADRIKTLLHQSVHGSLEITISVGAASIDVTTSSWQSLVSQADAAMYEAKRAGKNRAVHHDALRDNLVLSTHALAGL